MREKTGAYAHSRLTQAFEYMNKALEILDEMDAPAQIAPHLDLAIRRLEELLWPERADNCEVLELREEIEFAIPHTVTRDAI